MKTKTIDAGTLLTASPKAVAMTKGEVMDMIEKFFEKKLIDNRNTKQAYRQGINMFFEAIGKTPETYFKSGNNYEEDIATFFKSLKDMPGLSKKNRVNAARQFLSTYDRNIKTLEIWDTIRDRIKGSEPISEETPMEAEDIRKILQYSDVCAKAMFLMMSSSGMRMESLIGIVPSDIHDDEEPTRIVLRPEIVKGKRQTITTFMTPEATESYHAWMKVRAQWLASAVRRTTTKSEKKVVPTKIQLDDRVFPMSGANVRLMWSNMTAKAGYGQKDKKTKRALCHPHGIRKFFRSWLGDSDLSEVCMGHKGYLSTYRQYDYKALAKIYAKHMNNLNIFSKPVDLAGFTDDLKAKDTEIQKMKDEMQDLKLKIVELMLAKHEAQINGGQIDGAPNGNGISH